jgi:hypothetical protein
VNFYEVLADGYHTPLTKTQITELFHAGRLHRNHPCKQVVQKEWRTIDELFPLLKYQSTAPPSYYSPETDAHSPRTHILIIAILIAALAAALWYYFASDLAERSDRSRVTVRHWPTTIASTPNFAAPTPLREQAADVATTAPVTVYATDLRQAQLAEQRRQVEQRQREQTERDRLQAERAELERKAAGQDIIIPLDQDMTINFSGMSVGVKIHENDVTSFDVWINGLRSREVPKKKGITHSGTEETLIYDSGKARLYYVWELSGKLNHCRLRIRED